MEEERIQAILRKVIHPESNCVDVGSHYGSTLSRFCDLAPKGRHVAVEAIPSKAKFLRRKFPEVDVFEVALSDHAGSASFYVNVDATGFSGLARHGTGKFERIDVTCLRLDEVVTKERRFDFLKIDVEGAELFVLRGASKFLTRDRPTILFECGPSGPSVFGYAAGDLYDCLIADGYSVFFLKDALGRGLPVTRASFEAALVYPFKAFNWLAVANQRIPEILENSELF
jgi:FkbM family methyltransferase